MLVPHSWRFGGRKYLYVGRPSLFFPGSDLKVRIRQDGEAHYLNHKYVRPSQEVSRGAELTSLGRAR